MPVSIASSIWPSPTHPLLSFNHLFLKDLLPLTLTLTSILSVTRSHSFSHSHSHSPVTGVAILVPLIWWTAQVAPPSHLLPRAMACCVREGSPDHADCKKSPGATTSGLIRPSLVGPIELKHAKRLDWNMQVSVWSHSHHEISNADSVQVSGERRRLCADAYRC